MGGKIGKQWEQIFIKNPTMYSLNNVDRKFFVKFIKSTYIRSIVRFSNISSDEKILEAGCGSGKFSVCLAILGFDVTALDYSAQMLENTKALVKNAERYYGKLKIKTTKQDLNNLAFPKSTFDVTFNEGVVEHCLDEAERVRVITEMTRVTKEGGSVIIFVPHGKHVLHHWWEWTKYPGYVGSPEMVRYDVVKLKEEMKAAGLGSFYTDGIDPFLSLSQWPTNKAFSLFTKILAKTIPLPRPFRQKFGGNIVVMGKKKS